MTGRQLHTASWLAGIAGLAAVVWYTSPQAFLRLAGSVGAAGALGWLALFLAARFVMIELTVRPVRALGFPLERAEAFWIGWIRTFSNQVFPFAGLAYYAHRLRQSSGISWTELAALSSTQLLLAAAATGLIGMLATAVNYGIMGGAALPALAVFAAAAVGGFLTALRPDELMTRVPRAVRRRTAAFVEPAARLARHPGLIRSLTFVQCMTILLQGGRLWVLFAAIGVTLSWEEALLILVVAEATALFQITPGGLGLREGAVMGAAMLLAVSPETAASVALLDRLFSMSITTLLAAPALVQIYRSRTA